MQNIVEGERHNIYNMLIVIVNIFLILFRRNRPIIYYFIKVWSVVIIIKQMK